ncbi:UBP-type zinc finger domain-containing protein [Streptomyces sp. NPDC006459]|uniref:UBP-type zinc finger domain-containing protein n=1 Tax=Streptomyces sp. NPDC006459 TaxID=3154303 RepID=UPI0033A3DFC5
MRTYRAPGDVRAVTAGSVGRLRGLCVARLALVRLRRCVTCGYVGCCDSSRGMHAHGHHVLSGHPVALSLASDEDWAWCFTDEVFLVRSGHGGSGQVRRQPR